MTKWSPLESDEYPKEGQRLWKLCMEVVVLALDSPPLKAHASGSDR